MKSCIFPLVAVDLVLYAACANAQTAPEFTSPTWRLEVGGSTLHFINNAPGAESNYYGWTASTSQNPYYRWPWLGGSVDVSGYYNNSSQTGTAVDQSIYTAMGGPVVAPVSGSVQPFVRFQVGGAFLRTSTSINGASSSTDVTSHFALGGGGGARFTIRPRLQVFAMVDWLRIFNSSLQDSDAVRPSAGLAFRF